jgi:hypothetical protein
MHYRTSVFDPEWYRPSKGALMDDRKTYPVHATFTTPPRKLNTKLEHTIDSFREKIETLEVLLDVLQWALQFRLVYS